MVVLVNRPQAGIRQDLKPVDAGRTHCSMINSHLRHGRGGGEPPC
jgi:hypothetical protein